MVVGGFVLLLDRARLHLKQRLNQTDLFEGVFLCLKTLLFIPSGYQVSRGQSHSPRGGRFGKGGGRGKRAEGTGAGLQGGLQGNTRAGGHGG